MQTNSKTNMNVQNRKLAAILLVLSMLFGITTVVLADEVPYAPQGTPGTNTDICVYMNSPTGLVTDNSVTVYYSNIIQDPLNAEQNMVFSISFGGCAGINNAHTLLNDGKANIYSSDDFTAQPVRTIANDEYVSAGQGKGVWPSGFMPGRNGVMLTITLPANTLETSSTYYLRITGGENGITCTGSQGTGHLDKDVVFKFTTAESGAATHSCTDLQHFDLVEAAGCTDGRVEYWQCKECNKMYSDANAETEIFDTVIPAPHNKVAISERAATCTEVGYHNLGGSGSGYRCEDCGKYFKNNGSELSKETVEIPALGHDYVDGVCSRCGAEDPDYNPTTGFELVSEKESPLLSKTYDKLTVNGGIASGNSQYKFLVYNKTTEQWYKLRDFAPENTFDWYTGPAGEKVLYCDIIDENDDITRVSLDVVVADSTLKVVNFTSSAGTALAEKNLTTLSARAAEGTAPYEYKFIVYNSSTNQWYRIQDFSSASTCDWYTGPAGTKTLYVDVKDADGTVVRAPLDVTVA